MKMIDLMKHVGSSETAINYLRQVDILKTYEFCPHCGSHRIGEVRRQKYKCYSCKKEWGIRKGSILENLRVPFEKFLMAIKLFEMEISGLQASKQLGISYNTLMNIFNMIRESIYYESSEKSDFSGEIEFDEAYFGGKRKGNRGRGAKNKIPVFGILEREGKVQVQIVPNVKAETLLTIAIRKVKRGSMIYTDCFKSYDGLVSYGFKHKRINHDKRFGNGKVYINGIEGFWSFAKQRLMKHHGVSKEKFPLYLKELEFRYNMRGKDLFDLIMKSIRNNPMVALFN